MPVTTSYPGIYIEELPSSAHTITPAPTSITVFIGYTHPFKTKVFQKPVRIFSYSDYEREFGGLYRNDRLDNSVAYAVQQFFLNGGADAYVVGLKPQYYNSSGNYVHDVEPAEAPIATSLTLRAREPTDTKSKMTVTLSNIDAPNNKTADITIAYGSHVETFRGVSLDSASANFIDKRLAGSSLVEFDEVASYGTYTAAKDTPVTFNYPTPPQAGWTTSSAADFNAIFAEGGDLDKVDIFNLLVLPGVADAGIWAQAQAFCERKRAFLIMDPPANYKTEDWQSQAALDNIPKSRNAAIYFPYINTSDSLTNSTLALPPSGYVAGVFARTDTNRGVWKAPAGLETTVQNTTGVVVDGRMTDMQAGVINNAAVNALRTFPGVGTVVFGARTVVANNKAFEQWKYVPVRRMALFIEQTLYRNLGWVIFEPNDVPLWTAIRTSIERFMLSLFRQGAFQGQKPSEAFLVKCDSGTTTQDDIDNGQVKILVGFRPLKPAEFVIIQITQLAGQVQA